MLERRRRVATVLAAALLLLVAAGATWAFARPAPEAPASVDKVDAGPTAALVESSVAGLKAYAAKAAKPVAPPNPVKSSVAAADPLSPAPGVKTIVIDKGSQVVTLYGADGRPVDSFQCATGNIYPRLGAYKVYSRKTASMSTRDASRFYHFVIFTTSDTGTNIGFHSIPIDPSGAEIGGLGKPISHGCVRLAHEKAEFVYDWAKNGTKVIVQK